MAEIGLHSGQVFILISLWKSDEQTQKDLSASLGVSPPTVNKMVGSLLENGFVTCRKCKSDGRIIRVFVTPKGLEIRPQIEHKWKQLEEQIFADLTETEKLILLQIIGKLRSNLVGTT